MFKAFAAFWGEAENVSCLLRLLYCCSPDPDCSHTAPGWQTSAPTLLFSSPAFSTFSLLDAQAMLTCTCACVRPVSLSHRQRVICVFGSSKEGVSGGLSGHLV